MKSLNPVKKSGTVVQLRKPSNNRSPGGFWSSPVSYDAWGTPYAKSHDSSLVRIHPDGSTGDTLIYGTEWKHTDGDPVRFGEQS